MFWHYPFNNMARKHTVTLPYIHPNTVNQIEQLVQNHNFTMSIILILKQSAIIVSVHTFSLHSPRTLMLQKKAAAQSLYNKK